MRETQKGIDPLFNLFKKIDHQSIFSGDSNEDAAPLEKIPQGDFDLEPKLSMYDSFLPVDKFDAFCQKKFP